MSESNERCLPALVYFLLISFLIQALGAWLTFPEIPGWYAALVKPGFNPPDWVFGPVWTLLYIMMAVAAWLVFQRRSLPGAKAALWFYGFHLVLNLAWSWIFFRHHALAWALVEILTLWTCIAILTLWFGRIRPLAGLLLLPYWLWVSFATLLNYEIYRLNP